MVQLARPLLKPLSDEQVRDYEENGFLILRKGCSDDLIDMFNAHIHGIRTAEELPEWASPWKAGVRGDHEDRFKIRLFNPHLHDGFALQMMKLPIVRGALAQLMGDEAVGVQSMYFYKEPGSPGQAAHQDYYYIRDDPKTMVAAWIAMEKVDIENGCLWVIPGTHKSGLLPHGAVRNLEEHEPWTHETEGIDLTKQIPVEMEQGDILFFHELLIHSSNKNRSANRWRRSYVCHYIRHDAAVLHREDLRKKIALG